VCDLNRSEIQTASECHAGGHACWERVVELKTTFPAVPLSPLTLLESLDFLDAVWRLAFGPKHAFLRPKNTMSIAKLTLPCRTREEFDSYLSALGDTMKAIDIPDDLLAAEDRQINKALSFNRLLACLKRYPDTVEYKRIESAIGILRDVTSVRDALQHSGASRQLSDTFTKLGIPYPPEWDKAWDHIRIKAVEAFNIIREEVYRHATRP
jgi:hypothetical protein